MQASISNITTVKRAVEMLLTPSIRLTGRLPFAWKFIVVGAIFMMPLFFLLVQYIGNLNAQVEFSRREVDILPLVRISSRQMMDIASAPQFHGGEGGGEGAIPSISTPQRLLDRLEATANSSPAELSGTYSERIVSALQSFRADLKSLREQLNESDAPDIDALRISLINKVQALVLTIGDYSNLILDPDLDTYYLMDHTILKEPEQITLLVKLDAAFLRHARSQEKKLTESTYYELAPLIESLRINGHKSRQGIERAIANNPTGNIEPNLTPAIQAEQSSSDLLLTMFNSKNFRVGSEFDEFEARRLLMDYASSASALQSQAIDELETLVWKRVHGFESRKRMVVSVTVLAIAITAYVFIGMYASIRNVINSMRQMTDAMTHGDFSMPLAVSSRDELAAVAALFNLLAQRLASSDRFNRATLDALSAHVAVLDETGKIVATNRAWRVFSQANNIAWQTVGEGTNYLAICDRAAAAGDTDAAAAARAIRQVLAGERETWLHEYPCHSPDEKQWFYCRVTSFPPNGANHVVVAHENITAMKQAQDNLSISVARYESLSEVSPVGILLFDARGKCEDVNRRGCEMTGMQSKDALGDGWHAAIHPEDRDRVVQQWTSTILTGNSFHSEHRLNPNNGNTVWVICQAEPISNSLGEVTGYIRTLTDVTEQKITEQALRILSSKLAGLSGTRFFEAVAVHLAELVHCEITAVCSRVPGEPEQVVTLALSEEGEIQPNLNYSVVGTPCADALDRGSCIVPRHVQRQYPDDTFFVNKHVEAYVGVRMIGSTGRQIGHLAAMSRHPLRHPERVEAILKLFSLSVVAQLERQATERRVSDLFEFSPDGIVITDRDGIILQANQQVENIFGWTPDELVGQPVGVLMPPDLRVGHPSLRQRYLESALPRAMGSGRNDLFGLRKDGTVFPVDISLSPMQTPEGLLVAAAVRDVTERQEILKKLQSANDALERERAQLVDRVAERTADLQYANQELAHASQAKSEFLATMSHELRTPLNGILGMNELLLTTELSERQREYVAACNSSGKLLVQLINDILDLSKIEAGKLELDPRECNLEAFTYDVVDIVSYAARSKRLVLNCRIAPEACVSGRFDDIRLRQVLVNLVGNAVKFTSSGSVTIAVDRVAKGDRTARLRFAISDTGVGIPQERVHRLFKSFSQVDSSTTRQFGGTGLGLSICKQLIELMGGEIGVESQVGVGTTFWFEIEIVTSDGDIILNHRKRLLAGTRIIAIDGLDRERLQVAECLRSWECPFQQVATVKEALAAVQAARAAGAPVRVVLADCRLVVGDEYVRLRELAALPDLYVIGLGAPPDELARNHLNGLGIEHLLIDPIRPSVLFDVLTTLLSVRQGSAPSEAVRPPLLPIQEVMLSGHVLVAEDNRINQLYIVELLKHFGCTSDLVENGEEALAAVQKQRYDLVLMDCQMPEMDGFTAAHEIRKREAASQQPGRLPIVALTANALKGDRERCLEAGMDEYVSKPVESEQLKAVLAKYLSRTSLPATPAGEEP